MGVLVDVSSSRKFTKDYGDAIPLNEFIELCEDRSFMDDDGFGNEVLLDGNIIAEIGISACDMAEEEDFIRKLLLKLQEMFGEIEIVWYNK